MARELTCAVYRISSRGPFAHDYGLRDQMRRAAVSILSNIAEGFESRTQALFAEYRGRAKGSAGELRAQFYVAPMRLPGPHPVRGGSTADGRVVQQYRFR
jgi:four helix bundle protein